MECLADPAINEIVIMCSAQSAKTLTMLAMLAWIIKEDPGPTLWVCKSKEEAKKLSNMRLYPLLERCGPVAELLPARGPQRKALELYLPGMALVLAGSDTTAALQSTPYQWVFCDEARSYKKGTLGMISKRFRSFGAAYKKIVISTPNEENDEFHEAYLAGDQRIRLVPCPKCGNEHTLDWGDRDTVGGLKWDTNDETFDKERGEYRWDALRATIRYQCWNPECDHVWRDVSADRKYMSRVGRWEPTNENAPSNVRSYNWNAVLPYWASLEPQVREYLSALRMLTIGNTAPYKDHITETRGQVWSSLYAYAKHDKYIAARTVAYNPRDVWEEEKQRFMTVDVQAKGGRHYYYVVRAWGLGGKSRKLAHGIAWSLGELRQVAADWSVKPDNVAVDSGTFTSEVYGYVVESNYRWKALKGDDRWSFKTEGEDWLYQISPADPAIGSTNQGKVRPIQLYVWANYGVLDRLLAMMHGYVGQWQLPEEDQDEDEYARQVTAKGRRKVEDKKGRPKDEFYNKRKDDHYCDCEQMQIVCASARNLLSAPLPLEEAAEDRESRQASDDDD
jgi:phage terminase large subunit GpA-like protein